MHQIILDSLQEVRCQLNIRHKVVIYGMLSSGARFETIMDIFYNPVKNDVEQGIIRRFRSNAQTFDELCIQQGWRAAQWTYISRGIVLRGGD